jgi:5-formyltetrahydrofolate cyclo-ligase
MDVGRDNEVTPNSYQAGSNQAESKLADSNPADLGTAGFEPAGGYSSPACLMHEDHDAAGSPPTTQADTRAEWPEIRTWRKAKREALIARRLGLTGTERRARSIALSDTISRVLQGGTAGVIGIYWPFKGEYNPLDLAGTLSALGLHFALPVVVQKASPMIFRAWHPETKMTNGIWDIPVPAEGDPIRPDLLLVPLVGFDRHKFRLGYGGGYYDRTLAAMAPRPRTIGIGFEHAAIHTIFPQQHDIPMDAIVTEARQVGLDGDWNERTS